MAETISNTAQTQSVAATEPAATNPKKEPVTDMSQIHVTKMSDLDFDYVVTEPKKDADGNKVLDENGKEIMVPVLDENGQPVVKNFGVEWRNQLAMATVNECKSQNDKIIKEMKKNRG